MHVELFASFFWQASGVVDYLRSCARSEGLSSLSWGNWALSWAKFGIWWVISEVGGGNKGMYRAQDPGLCGGLVGYMGLSKFKFGFG